MSLSHCSRNTHAEHPLLVVIIPAYNEEGSIGSVIRHIPQSIESIREIKILVVDDGSTDSTVKAAREAGADFVIGHKRNKGLAQAFKTGMDYALDQGADIIVNIDADGQYDSAEIPMLVEPILRGEADIVLGDRQVGTLDHMSKVRKYGNIMASWVVSKLAGTKIGDAQTGFRALTKEGAIKTLIVSDYTYTQEMLIQAVCKGLKIVEIPIQFGRREGKSRLISSIFHYGWRAGLTIGRTYLYHKPLRGFIYIGLGLIAAGLLFGLRVILHMLESGSVAPFYPSAFVAVLFFLTGFQTLVLALIADMLRAQRLVSEEILEKLKRPAGIR